MKLTAGKLLVPYIKVSDERTYCLEYLSQYGVDIITGITTDSGMMSNYSAPILVYVCSVEVTDESIVFLRLKGIIS